MKNLAATLFRIKVKLDSVESSLKIYVYDFFEDLKPGDVIAIEEPMFKSIEYEATHMRCTNCLRCNKMSLIPSDVSSAGKSKNLSN